MRFLGIAGWKGSGKTTLLCGLITQLKAHGLTISTVKHAHHGFDLLPTDHRAQRWRAAGASDIVLTTPSRQAHLHELCNEPEPPWNTLLDSSNPADLVLIEGYKLGNHEKIEVYRGLDGSPLLATNDPMIIAIASTTPIPKEKLPKRSPAVFHLDNVEDIATFIVSHCGIDKTTR